MTAKQPTKSAILASYRSEILENCPWASDQAKLDKFIQAAADTLNGGNSINREGHYWLRALELNGIFDKKARNLKALWALPQD
jgi:hypothetical protein